MAALPTGFEAFRAEAEAGLDPTGFEAFKAEAEAEIPDRSLGEIATDTAASFGGGANILLKIAGDLYGLGTGDMENFATQQGERGIEYFRDMKSDELKAMEDNRTALIEAEEGVGAKAGVAFWETISNPALLTSFMFEQVPMMMPAGAVGRGAGMLAKIAGASAKTAGTVATGGAVAAGAAMQGADAGTEAWEKLKAIDPKIWAENKEVQELVGQGMDPQEAVDQVALGLSRIAAVQSAVVSGVTNYLVPGARVLEKALSGEKLTGKLATNIIGGFLGEGVQEGLEEGSGPLTANWAVQNIDASQDTFEGVGEAAGMGATSAVFGGLGGFRAAAQSQQDQDLSNELNELLDDEKVSLAVDKVRLAVEGAESIAPIQEAGSIDEALALGEAAIEGDDGAVVDEQAAADYEKLNPYVDELVALNDSDPQTAATRFAEMQSEYKLTDDEMVRIHAQFKQRLLELDDELLTPSQAAPKPVFSEEITDDTPVSANQTDSTLEDLLVTQEVALDRIKLSPEIVQFKEGADEDTGVVTPLGGKYERLGTAPIVLWERLNGDLEIVTGRHRTELARRTGERTIPSQILKESDGYTAEALKILDAEMNIRDEQGEVKDYVKYFQATGITEEEAGANGLLARAKGQRAFAIGHSGSEELVTSHRNGQISDGQAYAIALNAPGDSTVQALGIKTAVDGKTIPEVVNMMKAVQSVTSQVDGSTDMFGFDDSAMKTAEEMARIATRKQRQISTDLKAIQGAAKNPEAAKRYKINVKNPEQLRKRITALKQERSAWENWHTNPTLKAEIDAEMNPLDQVAEGRAKQGGQYADSNGAFYKGGQFLPNTSAPPGTFRQNQGGGKGTGKQLVEPGKREVPPTGSGSAIYQTIRSYTLVDDQGVATMRDGINWDYIAGNDRSGAEVQAEYQEMVDAYNAGQRWHMPGDQVAEPGPEYNADKIWYRGTHGKYDNFEAGEDGIIYFSESEAEAGTFGDNVAKARLNVKETFDSSNDEHIARVMEYLPEAMESWGSQDGETVEEIVQGLKDKDYEWFALDNVQHSIVSAGFDSFYEKEFGSDEFQSIGVYDESVIEGVKEQEAEYNFDEDGNIVLSPEEQAWQDSLPERVKEGAIFKGPFDQMFTVTRAVNSDSPYQVTRWDKQGAVGDTKHSSLGDIASYYQGTFTSEGTRQELADLHGMGVAESPSTYRIPLRITGTSAQIKKMAAKDPAIREYWTEVDGAHSQHIVVFEGKADDAGSHTLIANSVKEFSERRKEFTVENEREHFDEGGELLGEVEEEVDLDPLAGVDLTGITLTTTESVIEEDGTIEEYEIEEPAEVVLRRAEKRINVIKSLAECLAT